jgi:hypothetical protein
MKMKKALSIGVSIAALALVGQGCLGGSTSTGTTTTTDTTTDSQVATATAEVGQAASAGDVVHTVTEVEVLTEIPVESVLPEWEIIAEPLPADEGFQWLHIMGEVTNNTGESQSIDSTNVVVVDAAGNEYSVSTDTTIYVDDEKSPVYIEIQPTQTKPWEGYFMVPVGAGPFQLKANDLSFLPEAEVLINLGV